MITSIGQIEYLNASKGQHWFSPGTKRFFLSRIGSNVYPCADGSALFVSSERFSRDGSPRRYTVRRCSPDGEIDTVGKFQQYATSGSANAAARRLSREPAPVEA